MAKTPLKLKSHLFILIHGGSGVPYATRLNLTRLSIAVLSLGAGFLCAILGTLFFFRELEINRKLTEKVLEFETKERLARLPLTFTSPVAQSTSANSSDESTEMGGASSSKIARTTNALKLAAVPGTPTSASSPAPGTTTLTESPSPKTMNSITSPLETSLTKPGIQEPPVGTQSTANITPLPGVNPVVQARIGELGVECFEEDCEVRLSMVPTRTGVAQGELLVVLETEIPRIGSGSPTTQLRKRYFIYPGTETRDEFGQDTINEIARKPFRFNRGLQTTTSFAIGKLLRPLAVNVNLFDQEKNLIHHERKSIEREEP